MEKNLVKDMLAGKVGVDVIESLEKDELKRLLNNVSSVVSRTSDVAKYNSAVAIQIAIRHKIAENEQPKAAWKNMTEDDMTIDDVNKAIKQAQWYKHTYGPKQQKIWTSIVAEGNTNPMYQKAFSSLAKAPELYAQALADEDKYMSIRDRIKPEQEHKADEKTAKLTEMINKMSSKKLSKKDTELLELLKDLLK